MKKDSKRASIIDAIYGWCRDNPRYYGMQLDAQRLALSRKAQLEYLAVSLKHSLFAWRGLHLEDIHTKATVLIDARFGGKHEALWGPIAKGLLVRGISVALVDNNNGLPGSRFLEENASDLLTIINLKELRTPLALGAGARLEGMPYRSYDLIFRLSLGLMASGIDTMIQTFKPVVETMGAMAVISTLPYSPWSSALFVACKESGMKTIFVQQGLVATVQCPVASQAVVWSEVGKHAVERCNFGDADVLIAQNPSIPGRDKLCELRNARRSELGLKENDVTVLYLGQKVYDQVFEVAGYTEVCRMVGEACEKAIEGTPEIRPFLRPHYNETDGETENILRSFLGDRLLVSSNAGLMEDIAASDIVLSMHSTALEEAWLAGRPIVQVQSEGSAGCIDYGIIGAPVVKSSDALRNLLTNATQYRKRDPGSSIVPAIADAVLDIIMAG